MMERAISNVVVQKIPSVRRCLSRVLASRSRTVSEPSALFTRLLFKIFSRLYFTGVYPLVNKT